MTNALFGRGLVGNNVPKKFYDVQYNSMTSVDAKGQRFDAVINAGVSGTKLFRWESGRRDSEAVSRPWPCILKHMPPTLPACPWLLICNATAPAIKRQFYSPYRSCPRKPAGHHIIDHC